MRILVVDDERAMLEVLELRLESWGHRVATAGSAEEAEARVCSFDPDVILSDVVMPGMSGLQLLDLLRDKREARPVLLMTAHGSVDLAVEAIKKGAQDFLTKPLDYPKLKSVLESAEANILDHRSIETLSSRLKSSGFGEFVGQSPQMESAHKMIRAVADSEAPVLITGESGTGKELAARTIHQLSRRSQRSFVPLNVAAIPDDLVESEIFGHLKGAFTGAQTDRAGCFELADGGTLFLDEISEMPAVLQPKLLRVLEDGRVRPIGSREERSFDVRLLTATNRDPQDAVKQGRLRQDLFFRIQVVNVHLPPLREREGDVPLLVQHFVELFNKKHSASVLGCRLEVSRFLEGYRWPGNVRELKNLVERAVVLCREGWVERPHLPPYLFQADSADRVDGIVIPFDATASDAEKRLILSTLERCGHNKAEAARRLGIDVKTIRNKLKVYGAE